MFKTKYKIKADISAFNASSITYTAYFKVWWLPFWLPIKGVNWSKTQEKAEEYIKWHRNHTLYINDSVTNLVIKEKEI